jgi:hypothetical protein
MYSQPKLEQTFAAIASYVQSPKQRAGVDRVARLSAFDHVVAFQLWFNAKQSISGRVDFIGSTLGPSRAHIWHQLYWIGRVMSSLDTSADLVKLAQRDSSLILAAKTIVDQHDAIDSADLISRSVFGNHFLDVFAKARQVIGPREGVNQWPILMAA